MVFDDSQYRKGYSIGVGAVVKHQNCVLLVHRILGDDRGDWAIPGGFIEQGETVDVAVRREVREEAGVEGELTGLIGVRNRLYERENSIYLIFLLDASKKGTRPDGIEVDNAKFFTVAEMQTLPKLQPLSKLVATQVLQGKVKILTLPTRFDLLSNTYKLYM